RWVGQLSADERDRMRAHLTTRADGFADDFNRELTRAFFGLQIGSELPRDGTPLPADIDRFEHWYATAAHPDLVRAVYVVEIGDRGVLTLRQFHRNPARLELTEWPSELAPMHKRLTELVTPPMLDPGQPIRFQPVWPEIPAIAMPRVHLDVSSTR